MRILFIGDIVGGIGRESVRELLPKLKRKYKPQITIANAENSAHGKGITEKIYKELLALGIDVITMGNHTWDNKDIFNFIHQAPKLVRPANFPKGVAGQGFTIINVNHQKLAVINLQGRVFMANLDDPFTVGEQLIKECRNITPHIFIDFHAETTSEKQAFAWSMDGLVSAVIGTHTHVQTNDARILPQGTAFMSDVGMTGAYDSVLGFRKEAIITKFKNQLPARHEVTDSGRKLFSACFLELDDTTGKARKIENILINEDRKLDIE
ncbi:MULTISPECIES: TIGR00282 family metallophosphoesterase [unclassified Granulicatella]|uniref:TIGR00282 family metallophosphoesterase n=1 Tax=unclassified Granulicatella TaxID=2630493 RepID=UPI00107482FF|nr:TIGR00282 family metallophosphoesterase [Granulicatella sp. WM01]MBF0779886.1 TIGR00282 family metallophosphoesterase [Granulicatella sp. 19428wC4_WM01]TFU96090.1 TIGR00282 family metallophosphoesterase [Granulicatella sp. WM01]